MGKHAAKDGREPNTHLKIIYAGSAHKARPGKGPTYKKGWQKER